MMLDILDSLRLLDHAVAKDLQDLEAAADSDKSAGPNITRNIAELARCALRACGAAAMIQRDAIGDPPSTQDLVECRWRVHKSFGAPGDWGYGTPIGDALRALYNAPVRPAPPKRAAPMKIEITPTDKIVDVEGVQCRLWEGVTAGGGHCKVFVHRVAVHESQDQGVFERELKEMPQPMPAIFSLRNVL
jgi:hypothetical protein